MVTWDNLDSGQFVKHRGEVVGFVGVGGKYDRVGEVEVGYGGEVHAVIVEDDRFVSIALHRLVVV